MEKQAIDMDEYAGMHVPHAALTNQSFQPLGKHDLDKVQESHGVFDHSDGRLVVDPEEAKIEYGEEIASKLKISKDGRYVLWPQPSDRADDPQNWSDWKKTYHLIIITMAAFVPDFISSCGIATLFPLAAQFKTTVGEINNLTSNWSIFMLAWGGIIAVFFIKSFGRLPVLFWSQFIGLGFAIGCAVAPNLKTFAAMRILAATFQTAPQVSGLYTVCDMYPFHLQARKLNLWTFGFVLSPFVGPALLGFAVESLGWRWIYGIGSIYTGVVLILIVLFFEETMFDRHLSPIPMKPTTGLRYRIETLLGITAMKMSQYRPPLYQGVLDLVNLVWRPQCILPLIYVMLTFGFGIGINVTNAVFVASPPPIGFGFEGAKLAGSYWSPIVGCILGEIVGRYFNDWTASRLIRKNKGVFEAEMRLWTLYLGLPFFAAGFILLGAGFQYKFNFAGLVVGWVLAEFGILVSTVGIYAYLTNTFPYRQGEVSALVNAFRVFGGFAVPYFQIEWATSRGPLETFGCEAAIVVGVFLLIVPFLQIKGRWLRQRFSLTPQVNKIVRA
ncbi:hypothetical protein QFC22_005241 [Naganishia vaughanmartiniae]|uniref:Uncharacterized protein n=1 Tax=Naganishia vaughanmartiniae TaxID=1424756 RepID=A0ACC2WVF8_9TREE|nr:hypothetical protein QFC22_005241 [Naganishia vaughanmartiniae]